MPTISAQPSAKNLGSVEERLQILLDAVALYQEAGGTASVVELPGSRVAIVISGTWWCPAGHGPYIGECTKCREDELPTVGKRVGKRAKAGIPVAS